MSARKEAAVSFLELASAGRVREAFRDYVGDGFRHHNPFFHEDGRSIMTAMEQNAAKNPEQILEVQRAIEDGDLVAVHSRVRPRPDEPDVAVVHLFRFEGDRIAEMWDVGQQAPDRSPNAMGMF